MLSCMGVLESVLHEDIFSEMKSEKSNSESSERILPGGGFLCLWINEQLHEGGEIMR